MIEKMKVVHIVAAASEKTALLDKLRELGVVHFAEKASADQQYLERFARLSRMEMTLQEYPKAKQEMTVLSDSEFEAFYQQLSDCMERKKALLEQQAAAHAAAEKLAEWGRFVPAELRELKEQGWEIHIYRTDKKTMAALEADPDVRFVRLAPVGKMPTLAAFAPLPGRYSATEFPVPDKGLDELEQEQLQQGAGGLRSLPDASGGAPAQHPRPTAQDPERRRVFRRQQHVPKSGRAGVAQRLSPGGGGGRLQEGRCRGALGMGHGGACRRR